jgi:hypothetical protein
LALESTWRAASPHWSEDRRSLIGRKYAAAAAGQDEPEFDDPDPVRGWAAQYLNVWPLLLGVHGGGILPRWNKLGTDSEPPEPASLGIASDRDQVWLSLGAASAGEVPHLGSVLRVRQDQREFFVAEVARIQAERGVPVVVDPKGPAAPLIVDLEEAGVVLTLAGLDDRVQADSDLEKRVADARVQHGNYPDLNAAVDAAGWRYVLDRRLFGRKDGDSSALEAASLALWGVTYAPTYELADSIG